MKAVIVLLLTIGMSMVAPAQAPSSKPNLSGTWIFSPQKSALKVTAPTSMTLQINQNDPEIVFARTQTYGDQSFNWKLDAVADGQKEVVDKGPGYTTNSKVYWQGDSLVLDQKIVAADGTKVNDLVTYSLADGGNTLQGIERQTTVGGKGAVTNKWVYDKKSSQ